MDKPGAVISAIPLSADNKSCETASSKEFPPLNLKDSSFDRVSAVSSGLTATGTLAQPYNLEPLPASLNTSFSSMPNASLNISCNAAYMKAHSNVTAAHLETDLHGGNFSQKTAVTTDFTSKEAKFLAPITVQNISLIFLRRSQIEELLSDPKFTFLLLGAFVRIRNAKLGNNYRLVQIAGTTLQAQYYQVGKRSTNVVLEVQNLNKQQQIKIDHVSDHMFTQQSVELGFIAAPTLNALELKAAALQKGKARKGALKLKAAALQEAEARQSGHDGIWTIIDRFSKQAHFVPVKKTVKPDHLARLFVAQIFRLHGMPETIVSDRDPRFTSLFWKAIWENIGISLQFSSSFHPQTDGQSNIADSVVLDLLTSYISDQKTQWERYLPLVEFDYHNMIHSSTGKAPFEIVQGAMKVPPFLSTKDKILEANEYTRDLDTAFAKVRETLQKSQERQKKAADRH
ncbi:hypothetical protein L7F22_052984 [Adiantum nelumboides]|nr:hypothetical protein [Adiantum nelumboides]